MMRTFFLFSLIISFGIAFPPVITFAQETPPPELVTNAEKFNRAVRMGKTNMVLTFLAGNSRSNPEQIDINFLKGTLFPSEPPFRNMQAIANSTMLEIQYAKQPDTTHHKGSYIVVFIGMDKIEKPLKEDFYSSEWMRKFYACRFVETDGIWKITGNFCFNETGGPFPEPYG